MNRPLDQTMRRLWRPTFTNWAGNQTCRPAAIVTPRSEAELANAVRRAAQRGQTVRAAGSGHSWSAAACTDGMLLDLAPGLHDVVSIDPVVGTISVQAGITIAQLSAVLRRHGLAMSVLGSISRQTIAGAIATGTHGSGVRFRNLANAVTSLRLMTADGAVRTLSAQHEPELFSAARISFGSLGVITQVSLRCEPSFDLEEHVEVLDFDHGLTRLDEVLDANEHVKLWWLPHTDQVQVYRANRCTAPRTPRTVRRRLDDSVLSRLAYDGLLRAGAARPAAIPAINRFAARMALRPDHRIDRSDRVFNVAQVPVHRESEFAVPRADALHALRALRALIDRCRFRVNFIVEARFVAGDELMLSPSYGRDSCHLGAYMFPSEDLGGYFDAFEGLMLALGGRPHWGKEFRAGADALRPLYPRFDDFLAARARLDPGRVFDSAFTRRVLGHP